MKVIPGCEDVVGLGINVEEDVFGYEQHGRLAHDERKEDPDADGEGAVAKTMAVEGEKQTVRSKHRGAGGNRLSEETEVRDDKGGGVNVFPEGKVRNQMFGGSTKHGASWARAGCELNPTAAVEQQ